MKLHAHLVIIVVMLCALGIGRSSTAEKCPIQVPGDLHCLIGITSGDFVLAAAQFNDGSGEAVYFGGSFYAAQSVWPLNNIMRWDGSSVSAVGGGCNGTVRALAVYDDGSGPALYAGGQFTIAGGVQANGLAKWNGAQWSAVGNFVGDVRALRVFDSGTGPYLYVAGQFPSLPGLGSPNIVRWNGQSFSAVGAGASDMVRCLEIHDAGAGSMLYAGGIFTAVSGVSALRVACWTGTAWQSVGAGFNNNVEALCSIDFGSGPELYAGGGFISSSTTSVLRIARLIGNAWAPVGSGMSNEVNGLTAFEDEQGLSLFASGSFNTAGGISASHVARWDGQAWMPVGTGLSSVCYRLLPTNIQGAEDLYAVGSFLSTPGNLGVLNRIGRWDGQHWRALGGRGLSGIALKLRQLDWGEGKRVVALGNFENAGSLPSRWIGQWDGEDWRWIGGGSSAPGFEATEVYDGRLIVAGQVSNIGGTPVNGIAQWNGMTWSALGTGLTGGSPKALAVLPTESGDLLIAGGNVASAGSSPVKRIAQWDGRQWTGLGGLSTGPDNGTVNDIAVFDDGGGPAIYVGGSFNAIDGNTNLKYLAKWDGTKWSSIGTGVNSSVTKLQVLDNGSGPSLYVRGDFNMAGGQPAARVARWTGFSWDPLGGGVSGGFNSQISDMIMFDHGSGPNLYATGNFMNAGGQAVERIARWDGQSWHKLGLMGLSADGKSLAVFDDGTGPALYVTGSFLEAGGLAAHGIAKWNGTSWSVVGTGLGPDPAFGQMVGETLATFESDQGSSLCVGGNFGSLAGVTALRFGVIQACEPSEAPGPFALVAPIDDHDQTLNPQLAWNAADGLFVRYEIEVALDPDFSSMIFERDSLVRLNFALPAGLLEFDQQYHWRAIASNLIGETISSPAAASFTTMKNPDVTGDGAVDVDDLLMLINSWGECPDQEKCIVDLNHDAMIDVDDLLLLIQNWN